MDDKTEFIFTFQQLTEVKAHCDILGDFFYTSLAALRKLHKNSKLIADVVTAIQEDGILINQRKVNIEKKVAELKSEAANASQDDPDLRKMIDEVKSEILNFNRKTYKIELYTILITDFPSEREKFGKKIINKGQPSEREVDYVTSYLELLGTVISEPG